MTAIEKAIALIKIERDIEKKTEMALSLLNVIELKKFKLSKVDKAALGEFALGEQQWLIEDIRSAESYKKKMPLFQYEDVVMGFVIAGYGSPAKVPEGELFRLRELALLVESERFIESKTTEVFGKPNPESEEILELLEKVADITEEFHRGALYAMLLNFKPQLKALGAEQKNIMGRFVEADIRRYVYMEEGLSEDAESNLEFAVDLASVFMNDNISELLYQSLKFIKTETKLFVLKSLAENSLSLPMEDVKDVVSDLTCAVVLYMALKKADNISVLPAEYTTDEYIAKSDLCRWLSFPAELGRAPSEIEYLGERKIKKQSFRIFRFKSESENLPENMRDKWLIGWSALECGGTFSTYAEYEKYEKKTLDKTLAYIAKKIIG